LYQIFYYKKIKIKNCGLNFTIWGWGHKGVFLVEGGGASVYTEEVCYADYVYYDHYARYVHLDSIVHIFGAKSVPWKLIERMESIYIYI
jgi:hypothetical protein